MTDVGEIHAGCIEIIGKRNAVQVVYRATGIDDGGGGRVKQDRHG